MIAPLASSLIQPLASSLINTISGKVQKDRTPLLLTLSKRMKVMGKRVKQEALIFYPFLNQYNYF